MPLEVVNARNLRRDWAFLFYLFILRQSLTFAQAGVQRRYLVSLQRLPPGFGWFSASVVDGITDAYLAPYPANFCIFSRYGFLPCWWAGSVTLGLKRSACLGLPKCWGYRHEPPCLAQDWTLFWYLPCLITSKHTSNPISLSTSLPSSS